MTTKRAALYIRVSTDEQAKHGYSLPEQVADLTAHAKANGYAIIGTYADEGATARKSLSRRHELQRLLADVQEDKVDIIILKCLDRWFRNVPDYYKVQEILDAHHVEWECTQEQYNTTTAAGRLALNIRLSIAQNESDQTSERIKYVFAGKLRRREMISGNLPYGFKPDRENDPTGRRNRVPKHIIIDAPAAAAMRDMFQYYATHQNIMQTVAYAKERHGITWRNISMRRALANPAYIGTFYDIEDYAPAIIDRGLFDRVQEYLHQRRVIHGDKHNNIYLFSGLIHCPECGHPLAGRPGHIDPRTNTYHWHAYACNNHYINKECSYSRSIFENTLEKYLLDHLDEFMQQYTDGLKKQAEAMPDPLAKIEAARQKLNRLKDLYVGGFIDKAAYMIDYERYNKELTAALSMPVPVSRPNMKKEMQLLTRQDFPATYAKLSTEERRTFWHSIIERIDPTSNNPGRNAGNTYQVTFIS